MLTLNDLTNDAKRKQFFQNYAENFELLHVDKYNDRNCGSLKELLKGVSKCIITTSRIGL